MISDEEYRERIKAFADAAGSTMAEFSQGMRRLAETLRDAASTMADFASASDKGGSA